MTTTTVRRTATTATACPVCHAKAGMPCIRSTGRAASRVHAARLLGQEPTAPARAAKAAAAKPAAPKPTAKRGPQWAGRALADQTPFEIDTALAGLYGARHDLVNRRANTLDHIHSMAGDKKVYAGRSRRSGRWVMTTPDVLGKVAAIVSDGNAFSWDRDQAAKVLAAFNDLSNGLAAHEANIELLGKEYNRRPWSRFFLVTSSDGHIHSSMNCSTCNPLTQYGWHPSLSGKTEKEAVAELGPLLCTVCFASAPVAWKRSASEVKAEADAKAGKYCTGTAYLPETFKRGYADCATCGDRVKLTSLGNVRKHRAAK